MTLFIQNNTNSFIQITTVLVLIINTFALLFVIYQTWLSKKSLNLTRQSIEKSTIERQLEILPKFSWVIEMQVQLERWQEDLDEKKIRLEQAIQSKDGDILKQIVDTTVKTAKDLGLSSFSYLKMPSWLREIWMSGAQYYYNAIAAMKYLNKDGINPNFELAKDLKDRCIESGQSISILLGYIKDMVPPVILNTPASLSDKDFLI